MNNNHSKINQVNALMIKTAGFEEYLGEYKACIFDADCGEPTMWGFAIIKYLGPTKFFELKKKEILECAGQRLWFVIRKYLTKQEAIEKYGEITNEEYGPRGGHISVTYGSKRFLTKLK